MASHQDDEGVISFAHDDDDDDDMADLFSFGVATPDKPKEPVDYSGVMASVMPVLTINNNHDDGSTHSDDSFIELLEQRKEATVVDVTDVLRNKNKSNNDNIDVDNNNGDNTEEGKDKNEDGNMQEILDWLDEDDERQNDLGEEEIHFVPPPKPVQEESVFQQTRPPTPPPEFDTLEQAAKSSKATMRQIRDLMEKEHFVVTSQVRPHLWCRFICGKTLDEILESSVADSFQQWEQNWQTERETKYSEQQKQMVDWLEKESSTLADRIVAVLKVDEKEPSRQALTAILVNHYVTGNKKASFEDGTSSSDDGGGPDEDYKDPLLPPVATSILSAGVPKVGAAVMLTHIVPHFMPILGLTTKERAKAASVMHRQFYLLACYHIPLLVMHLDRYFPNWYTWPPKGFVPQCFLLSHLAGEVDGTMMNPEWVLHLWDLILASNNNSLRFFLALSVLETHEDQLLLLTGDKLKDDLHRILFFQDNTPDEGSATESEDKTTPKQANQKVHDWTDRAKALWESTPTTVIKQLKHVEDDAVSEALMKRQKDKEEALQRKLEAEARAHQEAIEAERERKGDEARLRLTRARLVAFYRQYNPGKETNIDKIMTTYAGRYDVLDAKLKKKYGVSFNPAVKPPKPAANKNKNTLLSSFGALRNASQQNTADGVSNEPKLASGEVVLKVLPSEVLPILCWSKEANQAKLAKLKKESDDAATDEWRVPLKFYLVDSRPEDSARDQGRFPTSVNLSPESFMEPETLKKYEDMFESFRGSVHICIMGEGYSALPSLYGHKMTNGLAEFIRQDNARNSNCALFFLKKGFPFVSVLDGGFAAAHAFLCREGPKVHLRTQNVLTDYNPEVSIFGQFERAHNATGREKAQRGLQNLLDSSMTMLAKNSLRFETLASEVGSGPNAEERQPRDNSSKNMVSRFFGGNEATNHAVEEASNPKSEPQGKDPTPFRNPFARMNQEQKEGSKKNLGRDESDESLVVESVEFDDSQHRNNDSEIPESTPKPAATAPQKGGPTPTQKTVEEKKEAAKQKMNPFAGFGAALNNSLKTGSTVQGDAAAKVRGRNPFARFGMSNIVGPQATKKADNTPSHFSGLSQFRMTAMTKLKSGGGQDQKTDTRSDKGSEQQGSVQASSPSVTSSSKPSEKTSESKPKTENEGVKKTVSADGSTTESTETKNVKVAGDEAENPPPSSDIGTQCSAPGDEVSGASKSEPEKQVAKEEPKSPAIAKV